jgi:ABC-2 type transport system permease protein
MLYTRYCIGFYLDGKIDRDLFSSYFFGDLYGYVTGDDESPVFNDDGAYYDGDYNDADSEWLDSVDFDKVLEEIDGEIAETQDMLKNYTLRDYVASKREDYNSEVTNKQSELGKLKVRLENGNATENDVLKAQLELEGAKFMVSFCESIMKTTIPEGENEWLLEALERIGASAVYSLSDVPVTEEEFLDDPYASDMSGFDDYDDYCESIEMKRTTARRALMTVDYALEHGIELPELTENSTKNLVRNSLSFSSKIIVLAMVIVTANNIALEYSSGTIRLLLIRPRKRSKIIFSKFCALFTTALVVSVAAFILINVVSVIINGFGDIFTSDLICYGGVVRINSFLYSLAKLFLPLMSGLILLSLAFMMAVVTRKAALAIIAPIIVNSSSLVLQAIAIAKAADFPVLKFTVLPYLDLGSFLISPVAAFTMNDYDLMGLLSDALGSVIISSGLSAAIGTAVVLIHAAIVFAIGFIVFDKQQIKN